MPRFQDLTGQKFERLTVVRRGANVGKATVWICKCDCGNEVAVRAAHLKNGHTQSCGCLVKEGGHKTHGETRTRLYRIWLAMKARCKYDYPHLRNSYARKGIEVCKQWEKSYESFRDWAIKNGYSKDLTIDRIDNNKGYSPNNCRWVTMATQNLNKMNNHLITYNGETKSVREWADQNGINYNTLYSRVTTLGWSTERALCK